MRLTAVMPIQQTAPSKSGLPPVFISLMILLFRPIALIAMIIRNLLNSFIGLKNELSTPKLTAIVVIIEAIIK